MRLPDDFSAKLQVAQMRPEVFAAQFQAPVEPQQRELVIRRGPQSKLRARLGQAERSEKLDNWVKWRQNKP